MSLRILAPLLLAVVTLAGCSGGDGNDDDVTDDNPGRGRDGQVDGNVTVDPGTDIPGNDTDQDTWQTEYRNGTMAGVANPIEIPSATETFTVPDESEMLFVNITVDGAEVTMLVTPPGCTDDSCAEREQTEGGNGMVEVTNPTEGEWTIKLEAETSTGPVDVDYSIMITQFVPNNAGN